MLYKNKGLVPKKYEVNFGLVEKFAMEPMTLIDKLYYIDCINSAKLLKEKN